MTNTEIAWLAGYLEGEASFLWQKSKSGGKEYRYPLIVVGCIDRDVTEKAARLLGTSRIYKLPGSCPQRPMWRAQIGGKRGLAIMGLILPHMGKRRAERITELFRLSAARPGKARGIKSYQAKLTPEAVKEIRTSKDRFQRGFQASMARKYQVNDGTVWYVARGMTWKDIQASSETPITPKHP